MEQHKIDRINELSRLSKERELSSEELDERALLRAEYIKSWRTGLEQTLSNTYIEDGKGNVSKLRKKAKTQ